MNKKLFIVGVLILAIVGVLGFTANKAATKQGEVILAYNLANAEGITATFNGKRVAPSKGSATTYALDPGTYKLLVSKPGFHTFSTQLPVAAGQPVTVNVQLSLIADSTITSVDQLSLPGGSLPGTQIGKPQYFYANTWAVLSLQAPGTDSGVVIVTYDAVSGLWHTAQGPGTRFDPANAQKLPPLVQGYLKANNLVSPGSNDNG